MEWKSLINEPTIIIRRYFAIIYMSYSLYETYCKILFFFFELLKTLVSHLFLGRSKSFLPSGWYSAFRRASIESSISRTCALQFNLLSWTNSFTERSPNSRRTSSFLLLLQRGVSRYRPQETHLHSLQSFLMGTSPYLTAIQATWNGNYSTKLHQGHLPHFISHISLDISI